jgi:hypothetical protein
MIGLINTKESVFKTLENKSSKKTSEVFNKLLAQQRKPKNSFDEIRSTTYASSTEQKPGGNPNDSG